MKVTSGSLEKGGIMLEKQKSEGDGPKDGDKEQPELQDSANQPSVEDEPSYVEFEKEAAKPKENEKLGRVLPPPDEKSGKAEKKE
jgi:hypothetical protein